MPQMPRSSGLHVKDRCKGRRRTTSCVGINAQIVGKSESGCSLDELASLVGYYLLEMNLVNLATSMHRLAKFVAGDSEAQSRLKSMSVFADLCWSVRSTLSDANATVATPQSLSNVVWALATVQHLDTSLISLVSELALPQVSKFKAFELSNMVWAIAKLGKIDPAEFRAVSRNALFDAALEHMLAQGTSVSFRCLSLTAWAFATAKHHHHRIARLLEQMSGKVYEAECQDMANCSWACGTLGMPHQRLFDALADRACNKLDNFKAQELAIMTWGFATNDYFHQGFFARVAAVAQTKDLRTQHITNLLWAFSRVCPLEPLKHHAMLSLLPFFIHQAGNFKAEELANVALSLARAFGDSTDVPMPPDVAHCLSCIAQLAPYSVGHFSTQSLINIVSAFSMSGVSAEHNLFNVFGIEAMSRAYLMSSAELVRSLQAFLTAATQKDNSTAAYAARSVSITLETRIEGMKNQELQNVTRIVVEFFGLDHTQHFPRKSLRQYCLSMATNILEHQGEKQTHTGDLPNVDALSTKSTDDAESALETEETCSVQETHEDSPSTPAFVVKNKNTFIEVVYVDDDVATNGSLQRCQSAPCLRA